MTWGPIQTARIDFSDASAPRATDFDAVYPSGPGALARARQVYLGGNQLPARWADRPRFAILETGFGLGHNFLATWQAWRDDPQRCGRLIYLAIDKHPPTADDLQRAHAASPVPELAGLLHTHWPPATPDVHTVDLDDGRVTLLLAWGDVAQVLPEVVAQVDAFYLDGFAPARNPAMWDVYRLRKLPRLAAPGATVATWCTADEVRRGLQGAGFEVQATARPTGQPDMTVGRFAPRFTPPAPPGRQGLGPGHTSVVVVGAGLAGAAVARALAQQGLAVQVIEQHGQPAAETSGNAGGLFHGIVHANDGPHARWLRAAALRCEQALRPLIKTGAVPGGIHGLLRGEQTLNLAAMQALIERWHLPARFVQARSGFGPEGSPAWFYPGGGWVSPGDLVRHWLQAPGITLRTGLPVHSLQRRGACWQLTGPQGQVLAQADAVVLCNASDVTRLMPGAPQPWWPQRVRGQTTVLPAGLPGAPRLPWPLADGGYALQLADGRLLCGATSMAGDDDPSLRDSDHAHNLASLKRLTGWAAPLAPQQLDGRVGWRVQSDDRLPWLGPLPSGELPAPGSRLADQPRLVAREPGLWVFTALGSRGITQAALGGEVLAAWMTGAPVPLPASLLDAVDVARFEARAVRKP